VTCKIWRKIGRGHETSMAETETRPRRDGDTSRDRLETETSRPRPQPCIPVLQVPLVCTQKHHEISRYTGIAVFRIVQCYSWRITTAITWRLASAQQLASSFISQPQQPDSCHRSWPRIVMFDLLDSTCIGRSRPHAVCLIPVWTTIVSSHQCLKCLHELN